MTEQVSVIIPIYNAELFIEKAVNSVLVHDCVGEVILVDDGSTDGSSGIGFKLAQNCPKIRLITHPNNENRGAAASRNLGIQVASFPIISFLDVDDTYYENRFEEPLTLLEKDSTIQACFGIVEVINLESGHKKKMGFLRKSSSTSVLTYLLKGGYFHTNSITVRKNLFDSIGFFDQSCWPHEDSELWIRMAAQEELCSTSNLDPVASYIIHGNNLSNEASIDSKRKMWNTVFKNVFMLSIGWNNKLLILKQILKLEFKRLNI